KRDWSSDVCSSDLLGQLFGFERLHQSPAAHRRAHVGKTPRDRARRLHCSSSRLRSHSPQPLLVRMRDIRSVSNGTRPRCRSCRQDCQHDRHRHQPYATPPLTQKGTGTPAHEYKKGPRPTRTGPSPQKIIAAVTYSPTTTKLQYHQREWA